jgi:peptide methionine sulfoxide reductase msrA/msrB
MMRTLIAVLSIAAFAACSGSKQDPSEASVPKASDSAKSATKPGPGDGVAYFAGGCFWGVEHYMEKITGVTEVKSGYMGGSVDSPAYKQVTSGKTGHLEAVEVRYHTDQVDYETLAKRFFEIHDPTQANGQGPDIGSQYLSAVFYASADERQTNEKLIAQLRERGYDVVTELKPSATFWPAEDYHQDYYERTGKLPYCHSRVRRFDKDAK